MLLLTGHKAPISSVAFSPDGQALLSLSDDRLACWSVPGTLRWACLAPYVRQATFTPDGAVLAVASSGRTEIRRGDDGRPVPLPESLPAERNYRSFTFSPDGTWLAGVPISHPYALHWWELPDWRPLPTWSLGGDYNVFAAALAFRPDGRVLATLSRSRVELWSVPHGDRLRTAPFKTVQNECRLAFSPDGRRLAAGSGPRLVVLDADTLGEVVELRLARKHFQQAAFTPDGRYLAGVSNEETVKFWDTSTWELRAEYAWQAGGLRCLAFSPDGTLAAAGGTGKKVVVWDVDL
jgi:WD40 repeat protein